jgi:hypothetical protein
VGKLRLCAGHGDDLLGAGTRNAGHYEVTPFPILLYNQNGDRREQNLH